MRRFSAPSALLLIVVAGTVQAHETWLMPATFAAGRGESVRFDVSSGMSFPKLELPIDIERIAAARYRLRKLEDDIADRRIATTSLALSQSFQQDGLATLWLDLKPRTLELADDKVAEYLDEIDATPAIRARWATMKGKISWKETYAKHAKSFVSIGNDANDSSWQSPVGSALEFVPLTDPRTIAAGGRLTVRILDHSKPVAAMPVGLLIEGAGEHVFRTTDERGVVTLPVARAGRAVVFAVRLQFHEDTKSWTSDFATLTIAARRSPAE